MATQARLGKYYKYETRLSGVIRLWSTETHQHWCCTVECKYAGERFQEQPSDTYRRCATDHGDAFEG